MSETKTLSIDLIKIDGDTQGRAGINADHVTDLKHAWEAKKTLPPLVVFFDGKEYWLGDGFHRWHGAKAAKRGSVQCEVRKGTVRDAQFYALTEANRGHGLKLSHEDKRAIICRMLDDEEWGGKSTKWIADSVGFSRPFIEELRAKRDKNSEKREGKDGRTCNVASQTRSASSPKKPPSQSDAPPTPAEDEPAKPKISGGVTFDTAEMSSESKDAFGKETPEEIAKAFELREGFQEQRNKLTSIKTWMTQNQNHPGAAVLAGAVQRIVTDIDNADSELKFCTPYCVCVYCHNKKPKVTDCNACKGLGWITEQIYKAAPKGLQREKAKA